MNIIDKEPEKLPLFVAVNNCYVIHMLTMLVSLVVNNRALVSDVFVLSSEKLSLRNRVKIKLFCYFNQLETHFIHIPESSLKFRSVIHGHVGVESFLRLFIPNVCPSTFDRALYLDSDIIINKSISGFTQFQYDDIEEIVVAVEEFGEVIEEHKLKLGKSRYFNAGVLILNMKNWRFFFRDISPESMVSMYDSQIHNYWDQDILNIIIPESRIKYKGLEYNCTTRNIDFIGELEPSVLHFTGSGTHKPWNYESKNPYRRIYWRYRSYIDPLGFLIYKITLKLKNKYSQIKLLLFLILFYLFLM
jgi:lipopolysaccharide biosynthesis glycosyltransferase